MGAKSADDSHDIGQEIEARLAEFSRKRSRDKRKTFGLKIGATVLSAASLFSSA
jgi:hypothetical protein